MPKPIGLTGNMGSGKSTVALLLSRLPRVHAVVYADTVAKAALFDPALAPDVRQALGLAESQPITIERLREVFANDAERRAIETLVTSAVWEAMDEACRTAPTGSLVVVESALIYERAFADRFGAVVVATCPYDVRVERLLTQRGMSLEDVERRLALQLPETELVKRADYTIDANCSLEELERRVKELYETLLRSVS